MTLACITSDIALMFKDFGANATVAGTAVTGIFDAAYADEFSVAGAGPVLRIASASVPAVAQGNAVAVNSANYTVVSVEPDGTGVTLLRLQEA